ITPVPSLLSSFFSTLRPPPRPPLFPYTTLFRSGATPGRRIPPSRDSLAKLRAAYVATVMASIAGRENQPADQVFKNVQVLKGIRSEEHTSELQSLTNLVCRLLLEKKKQKHKQPH